MTFPPAWLQRILDAIDSAQQRFTPTAFVVAVAKRAGDDRAGMFSSLITFYGLLSVFPLLLLLITGASKILGPNSKATSDLITSALSDFPIIGPQLQSNIHALSKGSVAATIVSALFLLWGALGLTAALQTGAQGVWRVPRHAEPNLLIRSARSLALVGVIGLSVVATTISASIAASGYLTQYSRLLGPLLVVVDLAINCGTYLLALHILAPRQTRWRTVLPGAIVGGVGWTALQQVGGYLISHQLHRTTEIYGFFAIVLGLIFWLNLGARLFFYTVEINVVLHEKAWPRGLFEPSAEVTASLAAAQGAAEN